MNRILALVLSIAACHATPAHAATRLEQTRACRADVLRYCRAFIPNEPRIATCMKRRLPDLTARCRAMF